MSQLLYYLFLKPLSMLPLSVLYRLSDAMYWLVFRLAGYRRSVVWSNLRRAFPDKPEAELKQIMSDFYRHFFDLIVEILKLFSISEQELVSHCRLANEELLQREFDKGRGVFIVAGHYNNWEFAAQSACAQMAHLAVGIYSPIKNPFFNRKFHESRSAFGMELVSARSVKDYFNSLLGRSRPPATMFGADQAPSNPARAYWTYFLGIETPVFFGPEQYAREYDQAVVFGHIRKLSRGHYEMAFTEVTTTPAEEPYGVITQRHLRLLEADILQAPQYWLWTHKRWKRQRPADVPLHEAMG